MRERKISSPENIDFDTPGRRDYFVSFDHYSYWASHLVPLTVLVGADAKPGKGVVAIGSTHGNEYEGPAAIKHLVHDLKADQVSGRIILIPVLNVVAFDAGTRDTPDDGVNLNRAFPGDAMGSITNRLADFVTRFIFPQVDVVIDIHSGNSYYRFSPLTAFHHVEDEGQRRAMEKTARDFGCQITMIYHDKGPGLLTSYAERLGKISIGTELGFGCSIQAIGVSMAKQGILTAAIKTGQLKGEAPANGHFPREEQILVETTDPACDILATYNGHYESMAECNTWVEQDQLLGYLHDFDKIDDLPLEIRARHAGIFICQAWGARVFQGQVIAQVGKQVPWLD